LRIDSLLDEEERNGIDAFVQRKMEERESRILVDWDANGVALGDNEATSTDAH
jgi:hypothetical protein